jgi:ABC-2 type transport system permease protein
VRYTRSTVSGRSVGYVDWLVPGVLGMNMMFSCLFGVGYVIVRYRKNGFLKRLNATPLKAFEFILAQVTSRLMLIMSVTTLVFIGTHFLIGFYMSGSYLALLLVAVLGACSMISLGLLIAARVASEEFAGGLLNMLSWPMMFLSGVWFSLEGAHPDAGRRPPGHARRQRRDGYLAATPVALGHEHPVPEPRRRGLQMEK